MQIGIETIGQEREKVIVIDDLFPFADQLIQVETRRNFALVTGNSYPGDRFLLTAHTQPEWNYVSGLIEYVGPIMHQTFGISRLQMAHASFSLMTRRPEQAHPMTRIPHYDEIQKTQFALLHFLTKSPQGGTAFYRHRRTGFERITTERKAAFHEGLRADWEAFGAPPTAFMSGSNDAYEQTAYFEGRFNRLLIYSGALLHSAQVPDDFSYSSDPAKGRLTANLFVTAPLAA